MNTDEPWAVRPLINATVTGAARKRGVAEETIAGLLGLWSERTVDGDAWARLGVFGLAEIARKRGHRAFITLVTVPLAGEAS
jgi:transposase